MESLERRLDSLEATIDTDQSDQSIKATITILNNHINSFIQKDAKLSKLFTNLNNSKIHFYYDENLTDISKEELEIRKNYVLSNLVQIEKFSNQLMVLSNMEKNIELDTTILNKSTNIVRNFNKLQQLELKYNELLIRSINLMQIFLNLNTNIDKFWKRIEK